ncbi:MAG: hypothetical protein COU65_01820 [Candidatus Pacebacteria bacterium CG10_big_fil_rev_8_21_14_0_10_42_12]|nr:MAG: hypothetical protein COU65_01820 [Candidatus Pacebacteria bacterium CG10_big_fil_rev_8_21_14_0_10_42_12]
MPPVISSVKALLFNEGKVLFLKAKVDENFYWDLPGGKIEYGETPEEALKREVREEIDVEINNLKSVGVWFFYSPNSKTQVICHTFSCEPAGEIIIDTTKNPADESFSGFEWLTLKEVLTKNEMSLPASLIELIKGYDG